MLGLILIQKLREICEELTHDGDLDLVSTMLKPISHGVSTPMRREGEREKGGWGGDCGGERGKRDQD